MFTCIVCKLYPKEVLKKIIRQLYKHLRQNVSREGTASKPPELGINLAYLRNREKGKLELAGEGDTSRDHVR